MLDPADSYGSTWASLSGADFVHKLLNSSLSRQNDPDDVHQQQPAADSQQQSGAKGAAGSTAVGLQDSTADQQQQQQQLLHGVQDCSIYTHPSLEQALDNKSLIIDLAPRVSWGLGKGGGAGLDEIGSTLQSHGNIVMRSCGGLECESAPCTAAAAVLCNRCCTRMSRWCICWCPAMHTTTWSSSWLRASE